MDNWDEIHKSAFSEVDSFRKDAIDSAIYHLGEVLKKHGFQGQYTRDQLLLMAQTNPVPCLTELMNANKLRNDWIHRHKVASISKTSNAVKVISDFVQSGIIERAVKPSGNQQNIISKQSTVKPKTPTKTKATSSNSEQNQTSKKQTMVFKKAKLFGTDNATAVKDLLSEEQREFFENLDAVRYIYRDSYKSCYLSIYFDFSSIEEITQKIDDCYTGLGSVLLSNQEDNFLYYKYGRFINKSDYRSIFSFIEDFVEPKISLEDFIHLLFDIYTKVHHGSFLDRNTLNESQINEIYLYKAFLISGIATYSDVYTDIEWGLVYLSEIIKFNHKKHAPNLPLFLGYNKAMQILKKVKLIVDNNNTKMEKNREMGSILTSNVVEMLSGVGNDIRKEEKES